MYHIVFYNLFNTCVAWKCCFSPFLSPCTTFWGELLQTRKEESFLSKPCFWVVERNHSGHCILKPPPNRYIDHLQLYFNRILCPCSSFRRMSCKSDGMILSAATLRNLEILNNQVHLSWQSQPLIKHNEGVRSVWWFHTAPSCIIL